MNVIAKPTEITQMQIPGIMSETCNAWDAYSNGNVVDQIDSGLRRKVKGRK